MPAYKFYNIGQANTEIARLEAKVAELEGAAKAAPAAAEADKKHAEEIKQLTDGHAEAMAAKDKELIEAKAAHDKAVETVKADHAKAIAAKDEEVKAAQKAGITQLARTGHTAVKAEDNKEQPGGAKTRDELIAEYNALEDPKAKGEFYEAHKKEMFGR